MENIPLTDAEGNIIKEIVPNEEVQIDTTPQNNNSNIENNTETRRTEVAYYLLEAGQGNIPVKALSDKYNVHNSTIYNDIQVCLKTIPLPDVEAESKKILLAHTKMLAVAQRQVRKLQERVIETEKRTDVAETFKNRLLNQFNRELNESVHLLSDLLANFTTFLEAWGFKEKIAVKLDIRTLNIVEIHKRVEEVTNAGRSIFSYSDFETE